MEYNTNGQKKFCLYDANGDISKNWFVSYYDAEGNRKRVYKGINREKTEEGRRKAAKALIIHLTKTVKLAPANRVQKRSLYDALFKLQPDLRPKTYQTYRWKLNHLFNAIGDKEVTAESVQWYFNEYLHGAHARTTRDRLGQLKRLFALVEMEHLFKDIKVRKVQSTPFRYYQKHQSERIMKYLIDTDPQCALWCQFVFYCFLRPRSELRLMKVSDIFFEERVIRVRGEIAKNRKTLPVIIPDEFFPALEHLKYISPSRYIFPGKNEDKPTGYNTMGKRYVKALQHLGFDPKEYSVYSWKHTGAVAYYRATKDLVGLQAQLRHHSLEQVQEYLRQLSVVDFSSLRAGFPPMF